MFAGKKQEDAPNDRDIKAFLEEGCEFEGKLTFTGVVRLNGKYRGEIESTDTLIVGETAYLEGKVNVGALILGGTLVGEVNSLHRVEILSSGKMDGVLNAGSLVTHEGATILASIKVTKK